MALDEDYGEWLEELKSEIAKFGYDAKFLAWLKKKINAVYHFSERQPKDEGEVYTYLELLDILKIIDDKDPEDGDTIVMFYRKFDKGKNLDKRELAERALGRFEYQYRWELLQRQYRRLVQQNKKKAQAVQKEIEKLIAKAKREDPEYGETLAPTLGFDVPPGAAREEKGRAMEKTSKSGGRKPRKR